MRSFQDTFETRKRSFISDFSISMTVLFSIEARNFYLLIRTSAGEILATLLYPFLDLSGVNYLVLVGASAIKDSKVI